MLKGILCLGVVESVEGFSQTKKLVSASEDHNIVVKKSASISEVGSFVEESMDQQEHQSVEQFQSIEQSQHQQFLLAVHPKSGKFPHWAAKDSKGRRIEYPQKVDATSFKLYAQADLSWWQKKAKKGEDPRRAMQAAIFRQTSQAIQDGGYISQNGKVRVNLKEISNMDAKGTWPESYIYDVQHIFESVYQPPKGTPPNISGMITAAQDNMFNWSLKNIAPGSQKDFCFLNMANEKSPGGGVRTGASAQEESWFRSSDYVSTYNWDNKPKALQRLYAALKGSKPKDKRLTGYAHVTFSEKVVQFRSGGSDDAHSNYRFLEPNEIRSYSGIGVAASENKGFLYYNDMGVLESIVVIYGYHGSQFGYASPQDVKNWYKKYMKSGLGDFKDWNGNVEVVLKKQGGGKFPTPSIANFQACSLADTKLGAADGLNTAQKACNTRFFNRRLTPPREWDLYKKMYSLLYVATVDWKKPQLVLSALGSGAFRQPVQHIASIWKKAIQDFVSAYKGKSALSKIFFVILQDHNDTEGNLVNTRDIVSGAKPPLLLSVNYYAKQFGSVVGDVFKITDAPVPGRKSAPTAKGGPAPTAKGGPAPTAKGGPAPTAKGGPAPTAKGGPAPTAKGGPAPTAKGGPAPTAKGGPAPTAKGGPAPTAGSPTTPGVDPAPGVGASTPEGSSEPLEGKPTEKSANTGSTSESEENDDGKTGDKKSCNDKKGSSNAYGINTHSALVATILSVGSVLLL